SVTSRRAASPLGPSHAATALPMMRFAMITMRDTLLHRRRIRQHYGVGCAAMSMDNDLTAKAVAAAELLETIAADLKALAGLDEELRIRLVTAAGRLSRPDRYSRKALGKALARAR